MQTLDDMLRNSPSAFALQSEALQRVARALANMCRPDHYPGHERCIELSQDELGHLVGASRQTISQA
jgi:CRP-like cAMP-binding protein